MGRARPAQFVSVLESPKSGPPDGFLSWAGVYGFFKRHLDFGKGWSFDFKKGIREIPSFQPPSSLNVSV